MHSHVYTCAHLLPPTYWPLRPCLFVPRATATNTVPPAQTVSPLVPLQPCRVLRTTPWDACPSCSLGDPTLTPAGHGVTLRVLSQMKESPLTSLGRGALGSSWAEAGGSEAQTWCITRPRRHHRNTPQPQSVSERTCRTTHHKKEK